MHKSRLTADQYAITLKVRGTCHGWSQTENVRQITCRCLHPRPARWCGSHPWQGLKRAPSGSSLQAWLLLFISEEDTGGLAGMTSTMSSERGSQPICEYGATPFSVHQPPRSPINLKFLPSSEEDTSGLATIISTMSSAGISAELRVWDKPLFCLSTTRESPSAPTSFSVVRKIQVDSQQNQHPELLRDLR